MIILKKKGILRRQDFFFMGGGRLKPKNRGGPRGGRKLLRFFLKRGGRDWITDYNEIDKIMDLNLY